MFTELMRLKELYFLLMVADTINAIDKQILETLPTSEEDLDLIFNKLKL